VNSEYVPIRSDENFQLHYSLNLLAQRLDRVWRSWATL